MLAAIGNFKSNKMKTKELGAQLALSYTSSFGKCLRRRTDYDV